MSVNYEAILLNFILAIEAFLAAFLCVCVCIFGSEVLTSWISHIVVLQNL